MQHQHCSPNISTHYSLNRSLNNHTLPLTLLQLPPVNDSKASCCAELGPVCRPAQPLQVFAQEGVDGCARVHERVGQDGGAVGDAHTRVNGTLDVLQDLLVCLFAFG